jgi:hypothetical protein
MLARFCAVITIGSKEFGTMPYDLFISYSRRDNAQGRITELVERIKQDFVSFEGIQERRGERRKYEG